MSLIIEILNNHITGWRRVLKTGGGVQNDYRLNASASSWIGNRTPEFPVNLFPNFPIFQSTAVSFLILSILVFALLCGIFSSMHFLSVFMFSSTA